MDKYIFLNGELEFLEDFTENNNIFDKNGNYGLWIEESINCEMQIISLSNKIFTGNLALAFEKEKALLTPKYPMVVCGTSVYIDETEENIEDRETILNNWALISSKEELNTWINLYKISICYMFDIKNDIFLSLKKQYEKDIEMLKRKYEERVMRTISLKGDILITDPCYFIEDKDWGVLEWDNNFEKFGIYNSICRDNLYGDWSCLTFNSDTGERIGTFTADAGMVCVCLLDEVLKYSKKILPYIEKGCATVINNFDGYVHFEILNKDDLIVKGEGNINFETKQIGL